MTTHNLAVGDSYHPPKVTHDSTLSVNRSVQRAMSILDVVGNYADGATPAKIADEVGLPRPTALRLLLTLEGEGFVTREDGRFYLGWEVYRLGRSANPFRGIQTRVKAVIDLLSDELNENVTYAVVTGPTSYDFVAESFGTRLLSLSPGHLGRRFPPHATVAGKVLLANLDDSEIISLFPEKLTAITEYTITDRGELLKELAKVRADGYATIDNELEVGLFSVARGVYDNHDSLIGILLVSGAGERMKAAGIEHVLKRLESATAQLSERLASPNPS